MELKPGYKRTELGIIPEDWEVCSLGSMGSFTKGQGIRKDEAASGDIPCIRYGEIYTRHNNIIRTFFSSISAEIARSSKRLKKGDLLFAGSGETKEEIGKCVAFVDDVEAYAGGDIVIFSPIKSDSRFLGYLLNAPGVARQKASRGQGDAVVHIGSNALGLLAIAVPPKAEQEAIAEALSDVDALIESLEQLIAKKRHVKQGAMQELLRPKAEWESKFVAEVADCLDNLRIPLNDSHRTKMQGDYPYCGANGVLDHINNFCVNDSVILMAEDGGYFDEYATRPIAYRMSGKFWVNNHAHILKSKASFDQDFLFYSLVHKNIQSFLASGTRAKLNKSEMNKIVIDSPAAKSKQTAIAAILSDMDAEIAALEARRDKARRIKQGMMQELLTGQTRLRKGAAA